MPLRGWGRILDRRQWDQSATTVAQRSYFARVTNEGDSKNGPGIESDQSGSSDEDSDSDFTGVDE